MPSEGRGLHRITLSEDTSTVLRNGELMETKLERIADKSAHTPKPEFTSLYHLINAEMLMQCHEELDGRKAVGIDEMTKAEYGRNLEANVASLVYRLKTKAYKPQPAKRVYIPKDNGKMRPLAIACYEDKIVQMALKKILEAIYEPKFLDSMYGFRPGKSCHDAIKVVYNRLNQGRICYVVDADIKGFFDHIDHEWLVKFLELYIKDPNIIWLVKKFLKAGVMDDGEFNATDEGSPQGSIVSPILANIYMHFVLTLWYKIKIGKQCKGDNFLVNYADDFIAGFQYQWEAESYYSQLKERMNKFGLDLEESKSHMVMMGRYIANARIKQGGNTKFGTFDFLGFSFYCGKTKAGKPWIIPKTSGKKFRKKVKAMKVWLYQHRDIPLGLIMKTINMKLVGHYRYYGVSFNSRWIANFWFQTRELLYKILNRRSDRKSYTRDEFVQMLKYYPLATPKIYVSLFQWT